MLLCISKHVLEKPAPTMAELAIVVVANTGVRNGEVRGLRRCDVNIDVPCITVSGMAVGGHREERVKADSSAGVRCLELNSFAARAVEIAMEKSTDDVFVFTRNEAYKDGSEVAVTEQSLRRALKRICDVLGITYRNIHGLRFAVATALAESGTNVQTLQKILGHTTPTMSLHYVRTAEKATPIQIWSAADTNGPQIQKIENAPNAVNISIRST